MYALWEMVQGFSDFIELLFQPHRRRGRSRRRQRDEDGFGGPRKPST